MKFFCQFGKCNNALTCLSNISSHIITLGLRLYIFKIFFISGLTKIQNLDSTRLLFKYEYHVTWFPLPPPIIKKFHLSIPAFSSTLAAYSGTFFELVLPVFIVLGIGARLPTLLLFIFNYIAMVSYPFLWTNAGYAGLQNHYLWGVVLAWIICYGPGKLSIDHYLSRRCHHYHY